MKILYGIQATGNGHLTRAHLLAPYLKQVGITVCYLLSGRSHEDLFDVDAFGNFEHRNGLTFRYENGSIKYLRTLLHKQKKRFIRDLNAMDLSGFDVVLSDYEPVTAWAAKLQRTPSIGLGHQYAFEYTIPRAKTRIPTNLFLRYLATHQSKSGLTLAAIRTLYAPTDDRCIQSNQSNAAQQNSGLPAL